MSLRLYSKSNSWGEETHKEILETDILPIKNEVSDCRTEDPDLELQKDLEGLGFSKSGTDLFFFDKQDTNNVKKYDYHVNADGTLTRKATYETSFRPGNLDAKPSSVTKPNNFGEFVVAVQHSEGNKVAISAPSTDDPENDINKSVGAIAIYNKPANDWNLVGTVYGEENNFKLGEKLLHFETEHDLKVISSKHESSYASDVLVSKLYPMLDSFTSQSAHIIITHFTFSRHNVRNMLKSNATKAIQKLTQTILQIATQTAVVRKVM